MALWQKTICKEIDISGTGIHSGEITHVKLKPGQANSGLLFCFPDNTKIKIGPATVNGQSRGTSLNQGEYECRIIEHFLAACWALGITNLEIHISRENEKPSLSPTIYEMPILDGCSSKWCELLNKAGLTEQTTEVAQPLVISEALSLGEYPGPYLKISPYSGFKITSLTDFPILGEQKVEYDYNHNNFITDIAPARTFGFEAELNALKEKGLAKGATLDNALLIKEDGFSSPLRFPDEPARHKMLDLLGDLATLGRPIQGQLEAYKPGHELNIRFVKKLCQTYQ